MLKYGRTTMCELSSDVYKKENKVVNALKATENFWQNN